MKRIFGTAAIAALAMMTLPGSAGSATQTYTQPGSTLAAGGGRPVDSQQGLQQFADCLVAAVPQQVKSALALPIGKRSDSAIANLVTKHCLDQDQVAFLPSHLRGALYIGLYRQEFGTANVTLPAETVDFASAIPADTDQRMALIGYRLFADCAARKDPVAARELVLSQRGSDERSAALGKMSAHFNECLFKGQQIAMNRDWLSGLIAEVLYRDTSAAKSG